MTNRHNTTPFWQKDIVGHPVKCPFWYTHPLGGHGRKVQQYDSKIQFTIVWVGRGILRLDQKQFMLPQQEAVGLPVQITGGERGCIEGAS